MEVTRFFSPYFLMDVFCYLNSFLRLSFFSKKILLHVLCTAVCCQYCAGLLQSSFTCKYCKKFMVGIIKYAIFNNVDLRNYAFSRVWRRLHVFASCSDWFIGLSTSGK